MTKGMTDRNKLLELVARLRDLVVEALSLSRIEPTEAISRVEQVIERLRAKLRENERPGYTSYTQIFVDIEDAETIIEALSLSRIEPTEAQRLKDYLSKPYDGGSDNHGS